MASLFVEEMTKAVLESDLLAETADSYVMARPMTPFAIPSSLHDSLMAQLDRLAPVKEVAQLAATLGRTFSFELLAAVSSMESRALEDALLSSRRRSSSTDAVPHQTSPMISSTL